METLKYAKLGLVRLQDAVAALKQFTRCGLYLEEWHHLQVKDIPRVPWLASH